MRQVLIWVLLVLPAAGVVNGLWFSAELKRFLEAVPVLASSHHMQQYKRLVARQMYAALVQLVILALPPVVFLAGLVMGVLRLPDVLFVIIPSTVVLVVALSMRPTELKARSIPTADPELERERDQVVATWLKKPLPDW